MHTIRRMALGLLALAVSSAYPCGSSLKYVQGGKKVLGIKLTDEERGGEFFAMDDDGMLTTGLLAAYCNQKFDSYSYEIPEDKQKCIEKYQTNADYNDAIYSSYYGGAKSSVLGGIKSACQFDLNAEFNKGNAVFNKQPLPCAAKVKGIAARAAQRYSEYLGETKALKLDASKGVTDETVQNAEYANGLMQEFSKIMSGPSPTVGDLKPWLDKFSKMYDKESFQIAEQMEDRDKSQKYQSLGGILMSVNAILPNMMRSMCGSYLPDSLVETLNQAQWTNPHGGGETGGGDANH